MSTLPSLPKGIDRDSTLHGRIYFTRAQMLEYGQRCIEDFAGKEDASRMNHIASDQLKTVSDLMGVFGMKR